MQQHFIGRLRHVMSSLAGSSHLNSFRMFFYSITEMKSSSKNFDLFSVQMLATAVVSKHRAEFCHFW